MSNALITGANRGIGLELTRQTLTQGSQVMATCRQPAQAAALLSLAKSFNEQLTILPLDVTNDESVKEARTAVSNNFNSLDLLINNAGILHRGEGLDNFDPTKMLHTFDVNVVGAMRVVSRFVDLLHVGTKPRIINLSSQLGSLLSMEKNWGYYSYNSSKAALNMVTRKLAHDLAGAGITVIAMHPGWVQTDMGGPNATISIHDSARGILDMAESLTLKQTGKFFIYSGEEHPW